ncbi:unnamed protein product [Arabidopsis arenosa]|uniref:GCK domain-containing protein n=1 Tax=Arabidopsis arenosa TaxID=38785 RepID=A0A8S1ZFX3_ARAAE|nr:unnamed protein product [Arabidopsis arenosa]
MGIKPSTGLKPENSDPKSQKNQVQPEKVGDSSSQVWRDRLQVFMKEGPCKETYTVFQDCVEEASEKKKESIGKCFPMLEKCMKAHCDYYQPILAAENAALELLMKEEERLLAMLKGGGCKESFMAWLDCSEEAEKNKQDFITKCAGVSAKLDKCLDAHSEYYQPYFAVVKTAEEHMENEVQAFFSRKQP